MDDLERFLSQMHAAARRVCYLTWLAQPRALEADLAQVLGLPPLPEYPVILNMLYSMGIRASVEIFQARACHRFRDLDEALRSVTQRLPPAPDPEVQQRIRDLVEGELEEREGWLVRDATATWALIRWHK